MLLTFYVNIDNIVNCMQHKMGATYRISRPIRRTIFPEKCDLNSTCVLCAEGKSYFQTYKYPYTHRVKTTNNHEDYFSGSDDDFLGFYDE